MHFVQLVEVLPLNPEHFIELHKLLQSVPYYFQDGWGLYKAGESRFDLGLGKRGPLGYLPWFRK
jgi:hypothetical protein